MEESTDNSHDIDDVVSGIQGMSLDLDDIDRDHQEAVGDNEDDLVDPEDLPKVIIVKNIADEVFVNDEGKASYLW